MQQIRTSSELVRALGGAINGSGLIRCPAHADHEPSLSIKDGVHGLVAHCFAGCPFASINAALEQRGYSVRWSTQRASQPAVDHTRAKALRLWKGARAARAWDRDKHAYRARHPFLRRKRLDGKFLRVTDDGELLVPLRDLDGRLWSLQRIVNVGRGVVAKSAAYRQGRMPDKWRPRTLEGTDLHRDIAFICGDFDGRVYVCEGVADALSIYESVGGLCVATLGTRRLPQIARALRAKYPAAEIVIGADHDEPGLKAAVEAASAANAKVAVPYIAGREGKVDFSDVYVALGAADVRQQLAEVEPVPAASASDQFDQLAALSPVEYGKVRKEIAEELGVDVRFLDAEVKQRQQRLASATSTVQGDTILFEPVEAWPEQVDGAELLDELAVQVAKHVILDEHAANAVALWIVHTHALQHAQVTPILGITSPEKRCGKSKLLALLVRLVRNALPAANISPAAVFRTTGRYEVTLLIDEGDSFLKSNDELRGVINSGHTRDTAWVVRTVGDDHEPRKFSTWSAKALALIGSLPDTLEDRSIMIRLRRKLVSEKVRGVSRSAERLLALKRQIVRWVHDVNDELATERPKRAPGLSDRAADNWIPLLAIANTAGGGWPERARSASLALSGIDFQTDSIRELLLKDLHKMFGKPPTEYLLSEEIVKRLVKREDRPWPEFRAGKPITTTQLANVLRPFEIEPDHIKKERGRRGYRYAGMVEAFTRYLGRDVAKEGTDQ